MTPAQYVLARGAARYSAARERQRQAKLDRWDALEIERRAWWKRHPILLFLCRSLFFGCLSLIFAVLYYKAVHP